MLPGLGFVFLLPAFFLYHSAFTDLAYETELQIPTDPWRQLIAIGNFLFIASFFLLWILAQTITVLGINEIENGQADISFIRILKKSLFYYWRVFCVYLTFLGVSAIPILISQLILFFIFKTLSTNNVYFAFPLSIVLIPILIANVCVSQLALVAIITNNLNFRAALKRGWHFLRTNGWNTILMFIILYFGCSSLFVLSFIPLQFASVFSILYIARLPDPNVVLFILFFIMLPFLAFIFLLTLGITMTIFQSAWTVLYVRISGMNDLYMTDNSTKEAI